MGSGWDAGRMEWHWGNIGSAVAGLSALIIAVAAQCPDEYSFRLGLAAFGRRARGWLPLVGASLKSCAAGGAQGQAA